MMNHLLRTKRLIRASFLFAVFLVVSTHRMACDNTTVVVYFAPFQIETYVPITAATIRAQAWEKWTISSRRDKDRLAAILKGTEESKFDEDTIRVLVINGRNSYFIDRGGVLLKEGDRGVKIDKSAFLAFRDSLPAGERQVLTRELPVPERGK